MPRTIWPTAPADTGLALDAAADPLVIEARREIIEHCLYGVDINPMAVEMAKLSLWLVSMDPRRPFTFLDDRLATGDSLLGITSIEQLEWMHLDPRAGRKLHEGVVLLDFMAGVRTLLAEVADERLGLVSIAGDDLESLTKKRQILTDVRAKTAELARYADLITGAALAGTQTRTLWLTAAKVAHEAATTGTVEAADQQVQNWLATDQPNGSFDRDPLHWPLVFPEVFDDANPNGPGFDAIVGNPPFLGGNMLTGSFGDAYREYLVRFIVDGRRGSADLIAYFVLRVRDLINRRGTMGLIAKSTLAEGVNKAICLDQIVASDIDIYMASQSRSWPAKSADIRYCGIWASMQPRYLGVNAYLNGAPVEKIDSSLEGISFNKENAQPLKENNDIAFQGVIALGKGFEIAIPEAENLLMAHPDYVAALFPYLDGDDLNGRYDLSASRYIINFHGWSEAKAKNYPELYEKVIRDVKPVRDTNKRKVRREKWWQYGERASGLYDAIKELDSAIVIARVSSTVAPSFVSSRQVFHDKVVVFASDDPSLLASLASAPHYWWVVGHTTRHGGAGDITYAHKQCFETFPQPSKTDELKFCGRRLDKLRREVMFTRKKGMTDIYNLLHKLSCTDADIEELRATHREIDQAVVKAYGWQDLLATGLDHGFHDTRQGPRYTIGAAVRQEILDRLLELNHERYAAEVKAGLHAKRSRKRAVADEGETTLF